MTGFVTCDFCEINELRQGLKINNERDFLFIELLKIGKVLEKNVREHSRLSYALDDLRYGIGGLCFITLLYPMQYTHHGIYSKRHL